MVLSQPSLGSWYGQIRQSDIPIPAISLVGKPTNQTFWFLTNPNPGSASPPINEIACLHHTPPDLA